MIQGRDAQSTSGPTSVHLIRTNPVEESTHRALFSGLLLSADLLLCGLALLFVFRQERPLRADEMTLCLTAILVGACLSCAPCFADLSAAAKKSSKRSLLAK